MKIAVAGAGAMGSLFGALLTEAGNDVWLYDVWPEHVHTVAEHGLSVEHEGRTRIVQIKATTEPKEIGQADLVIIFVKSTQTKPAAETARRLLGNDAMVMTLQNGMGNADIISEFIEPVKILVGTTSHGATMIGPGNIRHAGVGPTTIGVWAKSKEGADRARQFADFFTQAGIETETVDDVHSVVWNKLLINIGINAITALSGIKNGQILDLEITRELSRAAVEEAMNVALAQNVRVRGDAVNHVFKVAETTAVNRSSMGQDVDNKRQTEIEAINGFIVREAKKLGLEAPVNQTLTALVETLQYHY
ncbi:MAG: 2-dehydropantoate 2-reductase [Desulfobacterales bacterium]|nr:MAG: 2-dehydropantoate 2-reductase [Desulfobacterales bacterium]